MPSITELQNKTQEVGTPQSDIPKTKQPLVTTTTINGKVFNVTPVKWEEGVVCFEYLLKTLAPAFGAFQDGLTYDPLLDEGRNTMFADSLSKLSENLDGNVLSLVSKSLLSSFTVDGTPQTLEYFQANYGEYKQLLMFAIKMNYSSAFEGGWGEIANLMATATLQPE